MNEFPGYADIFIKPNWLISTINWTWTSSLYTGWRRESAKCLSKRFSSLRRKLTIFETWNITKAKIIAKIKIAKVIAKIKIVLRSVLTFYQNYFTASSLPVDFKVWFKTFSWMTYLKEAIWHMSLTHFNVKMFCTVIQRLSPMIDNINLQTSKNMFKIESWNIVLFSIFI